MIKQLTIAALTASIASGAYAANHSVAHTENGVIVWHEDWTVVPNATCQQIADHYTAGANLHGYAGAFELSPNDFTMNQRPDIKRYVFDYGGGTEGVILCIE